MIRGGGSCPAGSKKGVGRDAVQERGRGATWGWWAPWKDENVKTFFRGFS